jgi:hypothetical protein
MFAASYMSGSTDPNLYIQTLGEDILTVDHLNFWKDSLVGEVDPSELDRKQAHVSAITTILTARGVI